MKNKKYSSFGSLISAVLLFLFGTTLFKDPGETLILITRIIGTIIILVGVFIIGIYTNKKKKHMETTNADLISGVVFAVFGILIIILAGALETTIRYILGSWMIISGVNKLIAALTIGPTGKNYTSMLLLSLVFLGVGVGTILKANISISIIGIIIMFYSTLEIIGYILYIVSGSNNDEKETKEVKKIKEKVKDVKEIEVKEKK